MRAVAIGLGANLGDPAAQMRRALGALVFSGVLQQLRCSPFVRSPALQRPDDPEPAPDYCNAVALGLTPLAPMELLAALKSLEAQAGRDFSAPRWSSRELDLDLLDCADCCMEEAELRLPHPGIAQRDFVLQPWLALDPKARLADGRPLAELASRLKSAALPLWEPLAVPR